MKNAIADEPIAVAEILNEIRDMAKTHSCFFFFEKIAHDESILSFEMHFEEEFDREILDGADAILRAHGARIVEPGGFQLINARWIVATF